MCSIERDPRRRRAGTAENLLDGACGGRRRLRSRRPRPRRAAPTSRLCRHLTRRRRRSRATSRNVRSSNSHATAPPVSRPTRRDDRVFEPRKCAEDAARRLRATGVERELELDEERQRALAADEQIDELIRVGEIGDAVARRVLDHAAMPRWMPPLGRDQLRRDRAKPIERRNSLADRIAAPNLGARAVGEDAVDRARPNAASFRNASNAHRRRSSTPFRRRVQNAPLDGSGGKRSPCARGDAIDFIARHAWSDAYRPRGDIDRADFSPA